MHTPGQWLIVEYGDEGWPNLAIHSDDENRVCFMPTPGSRGDPARIEADAYLIAAAPDLLEALRELEIASVSLTARPEHKAAMAKARAAIVKATRGAA